MSNCKQYLKIPLISMTYSMYKMLHYYTSKLFGFHRINEVLNKISHNMNVVTFDTL